MSIYKFLFFLFFCSTIVYGQNKNESNHSGFYSGFNMGTWFPVGINNKYLDKPSIIGFTLEAKPNKNSYALNFDLIGISLGDTKVPILIKNGDTILEKNTYSGARLTLDYSRELIDLGSGTFELMSSLGYGSLGLFDSDNEVDKGTTAESIEISPGILIRCSITRTMYLQLKIQYSIVDYSFKNTINADLKGNYLITKLIIGRK